MRIHLCAHSSVSGSAPLFIARPSVAAAALALAFVVSSLAAPTVGAKDFFLTIGGGYAPTSNQASLEKNVQFFERTLADVVPDASHDVLFSDGSAPGRDVQYKDPQLPVPRVHLLLARVFQNERHLGLQYRTHRLTSVRDAATVAGVKRWFDEAAPRLVAGDRLFVYVTAHGGKSSGKDPQNTELYLWNGQKLPMVELVGQLNKLSPEVGVVLVMVQCHAGGFANVIFKEGQPDKGLAKANRAGFFATLAERPAAGCTADIREENYQEYSSFFWAALGGRNRAGDAIATPDYDGDGHVSLAEAHAYALLSSDTIDVPLTTSDALVRTYGAVQATPEQKAQPEFVGPDATYDRIAARATPVERAVLDGLSGQLGLDGPDRGKQARQLAAKFAAERDQADAKHKKATGELAVVAAQLRQSVLNRWPDLANPWNPLVGEIVAHDAAAIVEAIESHRRYADLVRLHDEMESLSAQRLNHDRRWAKCQRLLRTMETVVLAANLPIVAPRDVQQRHKKLLAAEGQTLAADMRKREL